MLPTSSKGAPAAKSSRPSLLKSPDASVSPNTSSTSTALTGWVKVCAPVRVMPPAEPYSTLTAPAKEVLPTLSRGAPTAKSAKSSSLNCPDAKAPPNSSLTSTALTGWVKVCAPLRVTPEAEPYSTLTAPASTMLPTSSVGAPAARSSKVSLLKSPAASAPPNTSSASTALTGWVKVCAPVRVSPPAEPYSTLTAPA